MLFIIVWENLYYGYYVYHQKIFFWLNVSNFMGCLNIILNLIKLGLFIDGIFLILRFILFTMHNCYRKFMDITFINRKYFLKLNTFWLDVSNFMESLNIILKPI